MNNWIAVNAINVERLEKNVILFLLKQEEKKRYLLIC